MFDPPPASVGNPSRRSRHGDLVRPGRGRATGGSPPAGNGWTTPSMNRAHLIGLDIVKVYRDHGISGAKAPCDART